MRVSTLVTLACVGLSAAGTIDRRTAGEQLEAREPQGLGQLTGALGSLGGLTDKLGVASPPKDQGDQEQGNQVQGEGEDFPEPDAPSPEEVKAMANEENGTPVELGLDEKPAPGDDSAKGGLGGLAGGILG